MRAHRKRNRKSILLLVSALIFFSSFSIPVHAANQISSMEIQAVINEDGSMYVTQILDVSFEEGTEIYIPMDAPEYLTISNLAVTDQTGTYTTLEEWDVNAAFEEKANKCGINVTESGYEICFGISQYGENRYAIEYKLDQVVGAYSDMDGVNFRFVNSQMNTTPTDVTLEIRLANQTPITDENCDIWGFGYNGEILFEDGAIRVFTEQPLTLENYVTVLMGFEKGILSPVRTQNDSFDDVKKRAMEGSDYSSDGSEGNYIFETILLLAGMILLPIGIILLVLKLKKKQKEREMERFTKHYGYFRDIPNDGSLNATYALGRLFELCEDGAILATGILRLIELGCLLPESKQTVGFMGKTKEILNLRLMGVNHKEANEYDEYLYTVLEAAAGSDSILQAKELEYFAFTNCSLLRNYIKKCDTAGRGYLNQKNCLKQWDIPSKLKYLTPNGEKQLGELMGFKKYLQDFSLIAERGVGEMPIWKELLSYAMLFGIADQVAQQLKKLYPNLTTQMTDYSTSLETAYSYHYLLYHNMKQAEIQREQEKRSGGSGGFASVSGGGGSIGGGSGGGTR